MRARLLLPTLAVACVPALVGTAAAQQPVDGPLTGFEQRERAASPGAAVAWTSEEEEGAFLSTVDAASERVAIDVVGESAQGRPLRLVRIVAPTPPTAAEAAERRVVLFTCSQHGDEPAGREGCLKRIRDLAFTADPAAVRYLSANAVMILPTANPDGRAADTRTNAQDIDINRDHLDPLSPEGQAIERLLRDLRPDVVADMHEFNSRPLYDPELLYL
jgi:murein tripeptide amidase MpaA